MYITSFNLLVKMSFLLSCGITLGDVVQHGRKIRITENFFFLVLYVVFTLRFGQHEFHWRAGMGISGLV